MVNQYTGITDYYDLLMESGYYDYQKLAQSAQSIVGNGRHVLEIGVGTGLLAEKYMDIDPTCEFTGIDFTPSMLKIAEERVGNRTQLIEADAVTMELNAKFEAVISNGGVWGFLDWGDRWELSTHIPGVEANRQGLKNLANHLQEGGVLLLHRQPPHTNFKKPLSDGITYSQFIEQGEETVHYHTLYKSYFFKKGEEILAQQRLTLTYFKPDAYRQMLDEAGFDFKETDNDDLWAIYTKR